MNEPVVLATPPGQQLARDDLDRARGGDAEERADDAGELSHDRDAERDRERRQLDHAVVDSCWSPLFSICWSRIIAPTTIAAVTRPRVASATAYALVVGIAELIVAIGGRRLLARASADLLTPAGGQPSH
jgi:hypothetical protein